MLQKLFVIIVISELIFKVIQSPLLSVTYSLIQKQVIIFGKAAR